MGGFITERQFADAETELPRIQRLYERLPQKPRTFLELLWKYERMRRETIDPSSSASRETLSH